MSEQDINPFEGIHETVPDVKQSKKKSKANKSDVKDIQKILKDTSVKSTSHVEKGQLIYQIQQYGHNKRFGEYLKSQGHRFDESYLRKMSIDDLKLEMEKNIIAVSKKNSNCMIDMMMKQGMKIGETVISNKTPLQLDGLTDELYADESYLDTLEMIKLKHNLSFTTQSPEMNLMLSICQAGLIVHNRNKFRGSLTSDVDLEVEINENDMKTEE